MSSIGFGSAIIGFALGAATVLVIYYAIRGSRLLALDGALAARAPGEPTGSLPVSLDTHIATEWVNGRVRLDRLLALIRALGLSLEHEIANLHRLGPSDAVHARETHDLVGSALRRFTFDQHLRNECRMLLPLLEFCGKDLAESQAVNTEEQLAALSEIGKAIRSADRD